MTLASLGQAALSLLDSHNEGGDMGERVKEGKTQHGRKDSISNGST